MITLPDIADRDRIERLVQWQLTEKWTRAKLCNVPAVGPSTYRWMTNVPLEERIQEVREALLGSAPWQPLVADDVPKPAERSEFRRAALEGRVLKPATRQVQHDSRVDHARMFVLQEVLAPLVERKLSRNAVAYRQGRSMEQTLCEVLEEVRDPAKGHQYSATLDIKAAYDEVSWGLLDQSIRRHLRADVAAEALDLVCSSYRAPVVDRSGRIIPRTRGIPQGSVLGPMLLNLYLADLDRVVARNLANMGARCWRYSDDFLVLAKSREALQQAIRVITRELERLQLCVKPETRRVRDLRNPQNPAVWLGYAFTLTRTWVPRERIERKAAELLQEMVRGQMSTQRLKQSLEALRVHHLKILHPDDADRAVEGVRRLLAPLADKAQQHKEDNTAESIRNQLIKDRPEAWSKPARSGDNEKREITLGTTKGSAGDPSVTSTPHGGSERSPEGTGRPPEGRAFDGMQVARSSVVEVLSLSPRTPSASTCPSLAAPALHRHSEPTQPDQAAHPAGAFGKTAIFVQCRRPGVATIQVTAPGYSRTHRARIRGARSIEATILNGYRIGLREAVAGPALLAVEHPTLVGQVRDAHRVRSPALMRAWELLLEEVGTRDVTFFVQEARGAR